MSRTQKLAVFVTTIVVIMVLILISRDTGRRAPLVPSEEPLKDVEDIVRVFELTPVPLSEEESEEDVAEIFWGPKRESVEIAREEEEIEGPATIAIAPALGERPGEGRILETDRPRTYTVAKGDTLVKISEKVYGDKTKWRQIYEANRDQITDVRLMQPGQVLTIPAVAGEVGQEPSLPMARGKYHEVRAGDSLYKLAERYYGDGSQWELVYEANKARLPSADRLTIGQKLYIPPSVGLRD